MATTAYDVSKFQTPSLSSVAGQAQSTINQIAGISSANSALNQQFATEQRDWQAEQSRLAMEFNMREAQKNRDWQEYMSNTAHQREVKDLQAAGLNPVLSAMGGNGAAVTSGATAQGVVGQGDSAKADTSASNAIVSILSSVLNAQNQLEISKNSALSNLAVADKYNAMSEIVANINASAQLGAAGIHAGATRDAAAMAAAANRYSADQHYAASKYSSDKGYSGTVYSSNSAKAASKYAADEATNREYMYGGGTIGNLAGKAATSLNNVLGSLSEYFGSSPYYETSKKNKR